jgi:hypothetical protein
MFARVLKIFLPLLIALEKLLRNFIVRIFKEIIKNCISLSNIFMIKAIHSSIYKQSEIRLPGQCFASSLSFWRLHRISYYVSAHELLNHYACTVPECKHFHLSRQLKYYHQSTFIVPGLISAYYTQTRKNDMFRGSVTEVKVTWIYQETYMHTYNYIL